MKKNNFAASKPFTLTTLFLVIILPFVSCTSYVVIGKPYTNKLRIGDGIKLILKDGTVYSGRVTYTDVVSVVIRTPKQIKSQSPVEVARFGTTIPWAEVVGVKVSGTLDSQGKLISNEEIRVNHRTNNRRNMLTNVGILGVSLSFLGATLIQDKVSPTNLNGGNESHLKGRVAFWSTFALGSVVSFVAGYKSGQYIDRQAAITRIERLREQLRKAAEAPQDSLQQDQTSFPFTPPLKTQSIQ